MGLEVAVPPMATFYIWLDLSSLPGALSNGLVDPSNPHVSYMDHLHICLTGIFRRTVEGKDDCRARNLLRYQS